MFQFPFGTMHQLNLDWFLQQWQQLRQDWIDEEQNIQDSMQDVYDARDAAIQAKDDAVSAKNDAETAKTAADADALMAEGFAVGEQNGSPVGPGSPYYQVNAKFYSTNAGTYRYLSEAYARGTMGGTPVDPGDAGYEDNAKYYKDAAAASAQDASDDADYVRDHVTDADASALEAEGWAVGEQGGTPVSSGSPYYENNAKYYAGEAQQDKEDADTFKASAQTAALKAEGFAVGEQNGTPVASGSPYYENNAEYYASQMAALFPSDISANYTLRTDNFTVIDKSIIKMGAFIFYSFRLKALTSSASLQVWTNVPTAGITGNADTASAWARCPQLCNSYQNNVADPIITRCAIGDKNLRVHDVVAGYYYDVCGFFKHNL